MSRVRRFAVVVLWLLVTAPAFAETDWSTAQPVTVVTSEYEFSPNRLVFKRGVMYRLHVENHGKELHEFHAPEFFRASKLRDDSVLNDDKTEIQVQPGQAKDLYLIPRKAGRYPLFCPDHDWAGMKGRITVK